MFDELRGNIAKEKAILSQLDSLELANLNREENKHYKQTINALLDQMTALNNAVPTLLREGLPSATPPEPQTQKPENKKVITKEPTDKKKNSKKKEKTTDVASFSYTAPSTKKKHYVSVNKEDKKKYLANLHLSESLFSRLKKGTTKKKQKQKKPLQFARFSNKLFRTYAEKLAKQMGSLGSDLKKSNIPFLLPTYLSMAMMSTVIAVAIGFLIFLILFFFGFANLIYVWAPILLGGICLMGFYFYPAATSGNVQKNITYELPFATIYMAAIAGSEVQPTKIFRIISESTEYPFVGTEIKKVLAQVEIYGYDIVTSLKNVASRSSNKKLSELFSGIATNISSGGQLKGYLEQKAETFLLDYRLERQKYSDLAETFMNVYISILIAAPLVLMMMFIVMNVSGLGLGGLSLTFLLFLSIFLIVIANIVFLVVLNIKQPKV